MLRTSDREKLQRLASMPVGSVDLKDKNPIGILFYQDPITKVRALMIAAPWSVESDEPSFILEECSGSEATLVIQMDMPNNLWCLYASKCMANLIIEAADSWDRYWAKPDELSAHYPVDVAVCAPEPHPIELYEG